MLEILYEVIPRSEIAQLTRTPCSCASKWLSLLDGLLSSTGPSASQSPLPRKLRILNVFTAEGFWHGVGEREAAELNLATLADRFAEVGVALSVMLGTEYAK